MSNIESQQEMMKKLIQEKRNKFQKILMSVIIKIQALKEQKKAT